MIIVEIQLNVNQRRGENVTWQNNQQSRPASNEKKVIDLLS